MTASRFSTFLLVLLVGGARVVSGIIGGYIADPTRYPYITGLINTRAVLGERRMGAGTLIAPDVVLAEASRVDSYDDAVLSIRAWVNRTSIKKSGYEYERNVRLWFQHPDYNNETLDNNIALFFLDEPVTGVPLVKLNRKRSIPQTGQSYTDLGFGLTNDKPEEYPENLMEVTVEAVPFDLCYKASFPPAVIEEHVFCAGSERRGHCWDDGGPLLDISDRGSAKDDVQVGVISYATLSTESLGTDNERCLMAGYPSGFVRVSHYTKWIDSSIRKYSKYSKSNRRKKAFKDSKKDGKKGGTRNRQI